MFLYFADFCVFAIFNLIAVALLRFMFRNTLCKIIVSCGGFTYRSALGLFLQAFYALIY